ncbi:Fe-S cluster assembly protein SufD [Hyphomicrobium facile]|uniref:Iron-regulated ABC transporter permease protein SufD n=1 Tax=Hyphomicrobium facile TaxID=51670 RepID=A0A1I7N0M5_9HYPH|nr:Fe-S cluster assembly protein SufD [Hyphomicrobium facile]SFV28203.1 Iron-regulated ABC transporter permease protein SufD [Hyphomicrobium facile]
MNVAVMKTKAEQAISESFEAAAAKLPGSAPVKARRAEAIGTFGGLGLPHRRIEEWKYTDLRANLKEVLPAAVEDKTPLSIGELIVALGPLAHVDAHRIVFVNGHHRADLSDIADAKGLAISTIGKALQSASEEAVASLASTPAGGDAVEALNTAFMTDGAIVDVTKGASIAKPLLIVFVRAGSEANAVTVRNLITVGEGASATIVEANVVLPGAVRDAHLNVLAEVSVGKGATLNHVRSAVDEGKSLHLSNCEVTMAVDATYRGFQFSSNLGFARHGANILFDGEGGKLDLSGAYLARGSEHVDNTLVVDHAVPHCESRELFKGVLDGHGRGVFQGKVIVRPDAQKTDGKQMSQALMLSEDAEFDSKPELEIYADDVVCGHGTTSAELDSDLLFYCRSRGIPEKEARALMIESFIGEALDKVEHEGLREALASYAMQWLGRSPRG